MTERDVETLVREAFRSRESLVDGGQVGLAAAVRGRVRRRRQRLGAAAAGIVTLAVVAAGLALAGPHGNGLPLAGAGSSSSGSRMDWRVLSSQGVEILVPTAWATNDFACGSDLPSVYWETDPSLTSCPGGEPPTKEVVKIEPPQLLATFGIPGRDSEIAGVPVTRGEGRLADGRYAGWILAPSRQVAIEVRTRSQATARRILDSIGLVDIDPLGCPTARPDGSGTPGPVGTEIPARPTAIGICGYGGAATRLTTSAAVIGQEADLIAATLLAAAPGGNPDVPGDQCAEEHPVAPDVVLLVHAPDDTVTTVWVTYSTCTQRGIAYGTRRAQVTLTLIRLITGPLLTGYSYQGNLPN